ncbi:MAG: MerR family transcriptional regulator [Bacteroidales bacterium]|nr:MerR family transcriptional regulator [Bacteroidales bacterium]MCD8387575.1 MerR family transcriptional regulator [Bacteroidales bacterium]
MESDLDKKYYKIQQVAEILGIPATTLRYWESQFTILKPKRTSGGSRLYTPSDIEKIKMIYYLVKERGFKLDKAQEIIKHNHSGVSKHYEAIDRLRAIRNQLSQLLIAIDSCRR